MLQLRPTFSESWYRVVNLKPRLRSAAQISRQFYRGERWYVVRDAASNQFHRLSDAAYRFVGLLDGSRTVGDAWDLVGGQLADDAPTQPEVIQILSQLYAANLVETDIPPDATVLLRRHKKQMQRRFQGRLMNILFPRIPIWDPDRFLCRWLPVARIAFSRLGAIIWIFVIVAAFVAIGPEWARLKTQSYEAINIKDNPQNFLWGFLVFWVIKFIHECGHAFACRRFGGEVHEMGLMLLVFVPTPYVDASTAWAFPNKWARMFVGAAGMIVELFVASLCAIAWHYVNPDTLTSNLLCYAMIIASFSTVVFNANPLLRYDGYYMLSDFLEIPNLQMRSREYLLGLIKRHVFRIKPTQPLPPVGQRVLLFWYGLLSTCYRVFVGIMIILVVTWQIPIIGVLMALGGVMTWLVTPIVRLVKYLALEPELHRKRGRAWAFSAAVAALVVLLLGVIPFPRTIRAAAIVEPEKKETIRAKQSGWVMEVPSRDGQPIHKGDIILVCRDLQLEAQLAVYEAEVNEAKLKLWDFQQKHPLNFPGGEQELKALENRRDDAKRRLDELTIRAPFDGFLIAPDVPNKMQHRYLERGTEIGTVATTETLEVKATIMQHEAELAFAMPNKEVEVRLVGRVDEVLHGRNVRMFDSDQPNLPHRAISSQAGGPVQTDPRDQTGTRPLVTQFELRAVIDNPNTVYYAGQSATLRLRLNKEPLYKRCVAYFLQLINSQSGSSKWL